MNVVSIHRLIVAVLLALLLAPGVLRAQSRPIVIQGGTLIDGTGRPAITDSVVVIHVGGDRGLTSNRLLKNSFGERFFS